MPKATLFPATIAVLAALALPAAAQGPFDNQLKARKGQFNLLAVNLGVLGGMARGRIDYDADLAQAAADNLAAVAMIDQRPLWPEGSDAFSIEGTRAEPTIWENNADFLSKWAALAEKVAPLQAAAGQGAEALGPAIGGFAGTCKACHEAHRTPDS